MNFPTRKLRERKCESTKYTHTILSRSQFNRTSLLQFQVCVWAHSDSFLNSLLFLFSLHGKWSSFICVRERTKGQEEKESTGKKCVYGREEEMKKHSPEMWYTHTMLKSEQLKWEGENISSSHEWQVTFFFLTLDTILCERRKKRGRERKWKKCESLWHYILSHEMS